MGPRIQLIHAMTASQAPIHRAFLSLWPEANPVDLVDTSLATDLAALAIVEDFSIGEMVKAFSKRMATLINYGQETGADAVLFTCSAFGPAIEQARLNVDIPVLKPDEAMIARALDTCKSGDFCIGGLATFEPTIASLNSEFKAVADSGSVLPKIILQHVPYALEHLNKGNKLEHDRLIIDAASTLKNIDILLLAQFSMSSVQDKVSEASGLEVLASPNESVLQLKNILK
ncbi:MAG: aspartate/glutamate racemase family protein [Pseudomonadota bacterium]|nr:aspartate/glutamate racemase family protein [Pseudomonadota bacterium]